VFALSARETPSIQRRRNWKRVTDELNGKMIACQILITGLIARVANDQRDPLCFLTNFRDEIRAVVKGVNIAGLDNSDRVRLVAQSAVDELFSLMKPPSGNRSRRSAYAGVFCQAHPCHLRTVSNSNSRIVLIWTNSRHAGDAGRPGCAGCVFFLAAEHGTG
jgi:hypothetical protein